MTFPRQFPITGERFTPTFRWIINNTLVFPVGGGFTADPTEGAPRDFAIDPAFVFAGEPSVSTAPLDPSLVPSP